MVRVPQLTSSCCAVIVNYRSAGLTERCVRALRQDAPAVRVVVVDNASGDDSADRLSALEGIELVASDRNGGFGAGCNLGFDHALATAESAPAWFLLLNPDAVVESGCLEALLACAADQPDAGLVGGLVKSADGASIEFEFGRRRPWTLSGLHASAPAGEQYATEFVTGALMLLDADLVRQGVRFDERYFLYVEDLDLCAQVQARGRDLWVTRGAAVRHDAGGTQRGDEDILGGMRPLQLRHMTRGKALYARKWLGPRHRAVFWLVAFVLKPAVALVRYRSLGFLRHYFGGLWSGVRAKLEHLPDRATLPS